jgi:aryl-alcohol dehydrogenase-like predicted oxidoreductase
MPLARYRRPVPPHPPSPTLAHPLPPRFVLRHPLVASAVVGASDEAQLAQLLAAADRDSGEPWLSDDLVRAIDGVYARYPNPTP